MNSQSNQQSGVLSRNMSQNDFVALGVHEVAYVKPIDQEGDIAYAVHAADGTQLTVMHDRDHAFAVVRQNDLEPVSAH